MPKSDFFQHVTNANEQSLLFNVTQELINNHGVDVYYIENKYVNVDSIYGEDRKPNLTNATKIVVYINAAAQPYDTGPTFSKFGFFNPSNIDLVVSRKEWNEIFGTLRPLEGSLIYIPSWDVTGPNDFLKIDFVDKYAADNFYPLGITPTFTLQCSKWQYASETVATGIPDIDSILPNFSNDTTVNANLNPTEHKDNTNLPSYSENKIDWTENNPFGLPPKGVILDVTGNAGAGKV